MKKDTSEILLLGHFLNDKIIAKNLHSAMAHAQAKRVIEELGEQLPARQGDRILAAAETTGEPIEPWKP